MHSVAGLYQALSKQKLLGQEQVRLEQNWKLQSLSGIQVPLCPGLFLSGGTERTRPPGEQPSLYGGEGGGGQDAGGKMLVSSACCQPKEGRRGPTLLSMLLDPASPASSL